jgi:hypothetical protein
MMGLPLIDNADLGVVGILRAHRYEFMFMTAPLVIPRATASPINQSRCFERVAPVHPRPCHFVPSPCQGGLKR